MQCSGMWSRGWGVFKRERAGGSEKEREGGCLGGLRTQREHLQRGGASKAPAFTAEAARQSRTWAFGACHCADAGVYARVFCAGTCRYPGAEVQFVGYQYSGASGPLPGIPYSTLADDDGNVRARPHAYAGELQERGLT